MKRFLQCVAIASLLMLATACTLTKWTTISSQDKEQVEKVMSEVFPELYERYNKGEIVVNKIKYRPQEDGSTKWTVYYSEVDDDDDDDELLEWMLIFAPALYN